MPVSTPTTCRRRATCRLCASKKVVPALTLTPTPPANAFVPAEKRREPQETFPLELFFCRDCAHLQLLDVVDPAVLFENYVYVSGTSPVFVKHFEDYAQEAIERYGLKSGDLVVDIGSNDGTLLRFFKEAGMKVLGVDPAKDIAAKASASGIETMPRFFSHDLAEEIARSHGPAALVTANNVFAHADDLIGIVSGIRALLKPDGVFTFEVSYLAKVVKDTLFDMCYHEHLAYHSLKPLRSFFKANGMELIGAREVPSHGGSLRAAVQRQGGPRKVEASVGKMVSAEENMGLDKEKTFEEFGRQIDWIKDNLQKVLKKLKTNGKTIAGFGAPAKATTLMYHFGIGPDVIDFIVDDSPLKQGLYSPGFHIPILPSSAIYEKKPDYLLILAWNFAGPIMKKHKAFTDAGGHFLVPLPRIEVLPPIKDGQL